METKAPRNFGLDLLRCAAIICVLIAHFGPESGVFGEGRVVADALGIIGVELFFVLSGYLIGHLFLESYESKTFGFNSVKQFLFRRWVRTLPNYYLFFAVWLAVDALTGQPTMTFPWRHLVFAQNLVKGTTDFYGVSWSLSFEEWFYLLFPILCLGTYKLVNRRSIAFVVSAIVWIILPTFARNTYPIYGNWDEGIRKAVLYRMDTMIIGVIAAFIARKSPRFWTASRFGWPLGLAGVIASTTYLVQYYEPNPWSFLSFETGNFFFPFLNISVALMLPGLSRLKMSKDWIRRPVGALSRWSYSIYLCHVPILQLTKGAFLQTMGSELTFLVWNALAVITAWLVYTYFENPILRWRDRHVRIEKHELESVRRAA